MGIFGSQGPNAFPKGSLLDSLVGSTKSNPKKLEERRQGLQRWAAGTQFDFIL